jgi:integrase
VYVRISLELQREFGLRREEATKFQPRYADQGDHLRIKGSWTKGGRERVIPITTPEQRATLDKAHKLVGEGSLIPAEKTYIEQRHVYDRQCKLADLKHMHGLRHAYAQRRYEALTGWKSPAAGGSSTRSLTPSQRLADFEARQIISRELGHERVEITKVYLGR